MSAGWVAGSVRSAALARRRLGASSIRGLAGCASLAEAVDVLARSQYGRELHSGADLATTQRGIAVTTLWNLRVLAGWLPAEGAQILRLMAARFEIANIEEHLREFAADPQDRSVPPFVLGRLATAWPRLSQTTSVGDLRAAMAHSAWGDPGEDSVYAISLWPPLSWADRVSYTVPAARPWAAGAAALTVAKELYVIGRRLPPAADTVAARLLGRTWQQARGMADLAGRLPSDARWVLAGIDDPADLWRGEAAWWKRVSSDGQMLLSRAGFGSHRPLGAAAVMLADCWQVSAALELASRADAYPEVLDAVA